MAREIINVGTVPNDGTGDPIRTAYIKCNDNFAELYSRAQTDIPSSLVGSPGDVAGMYAADSNTFYWCFQDYDGSSVIWGETPNAQITALINGSSNVSVADNANVTVSVGGASNIAVFSSSLATLANVLIPGTLSVSGNSVFADVLPSADLAHDLGSADLRWNSLYLGGNTIFLGNAEISTAGDDIVFTAPDGSEFSVGGGGPSGQAIGEFGDVIASGNITAGVFVGDGQFLTNITAVSNVAVNQIANSTSILSLAGASQPFTFTVAGVSNVAVVTATGIQTSELIANGNIQSGNVITTGNISAAYVLGNGSQLTGISVDSTSIANGTSSVAVISLDGNVRVNVADTTIATVYSSGVNIDGLLSVTGNVAGNYFLGNGSQLTGIDATQIQSGTSNLRVTGSGGNVVAGIGGADNIVVITSTGVSVDGEIATTGNVSGGNLITTGNVQAGNLIVSGIEAVTTLTVSGDTLISGNLTVSGTTITANVATVVITDPILGLGRGANGDPLTTNDGLDRGIEMFYFTDAERIAFMGFDNNEGKMLSAANVSVANNVVTVNSLGTTVVGTLETAGIVNTNANGVGNIGSSTTFFNTVFAQATSATYADIAENYVSDSVYPVGTVMSFGGVQEVTQSTTWSDTAIAGVVSNQPSYLMNSGLSGPTVLPIALLGRVRCQVTGAVTKGQLLISNGQGGACAALTDPRSGSVVGKSLQDFHGDQGVIEIAVGRL